MAARRLVVVMIVLLAISTIAAAFLPAPQSDPTTTDRQPPPKHAEKPPPEKGAKLVHASIDASKEPATVNVHPGDQVALRVLAPRSGTVQIAGFGQLTPVDSLVPATFDVIVDRSGTFPVDLSGSGTIGRIVAAKQPKCEARSRSRARPGGGSDQSCGPRGKHSGKASGRSAPPPSAAGDHRRR